MSPFKFKVLASCNGGEVQLYSEHKTIKAANTILKSRQNSDYARRNKMKYWIESI